MRKIGLLGVFLTFVYVSSAQQPPLMPIDSTTNKITYTGVVNVDSVNKNELYSRAREWMAKTYNSSKSVLEMDDRESGKIVGKGIMDVQHKALSTMFPAGYVQYVISIYLKDGRYKYELSNFYHKSNEPGKMKDYGPAELWINDQRTAAFMSHKAIQKISNGFLSQLDEYSKKLINDLHKAMASKSRLKDDF